MFLAIFFHKFGTVGLVSSVFVRKTSNRGEERDFKPTPPASQRVLGSSRVGFGRIISFKVQHVERNVVDSLGGEKEKSVVAEYRLRDMWERRRAGFWPSLIAGVRPPRRA